MPVREVSVQAAALKAKAQIATGAMVAAYLVISSSAGGAMAASQRFTADLPLNRSIGPLRAGKLCLPKGRVAAADMISDARQFDLVVRQALDEQPQVQQATLGSGAAPKIEIHLKSVAVRLCASSWGLFGTGDTKSLGGKADFTFTWKKDGQSVLAVETIPLEVSAKERLTAPAILRKAVNTLLQRMSASGQQPG